MNNQLMKHAEWAKFKLKICWWWRNLTQSLKVNNITHISECLWITFHHIKSISTVHRHVDSSRTLYGALAISTNTQHRMARSKRRIKYIIAIQRVIMKFNLKRKCPTFKSIICKSGNLWVKSWTWLYMNSYSDDDCAVLNVYALQG